MRFPTIKETYITRHILGGITKLAAIAIFFLIGAMVYFENMYYLVILLPLNLIAIAAYEAVYIDLDSKTYHSYINIFGLKLGEIKPLPAIDYVLVKDTTFYNYNRFGFKEHDYKYELSLVCKNNLKIPILYTVYRSDLINQANTISKSFGCRLSDITKEALLNTRHLPL